MSVRFVHKLLVASLIGATSVMAAPSAVAEPSTDTTPTDTATLPVSPEPTPSEMDDSTPSPTPSDSGPAPTDSDTRIPSTPSTPATNSSQTVHFGGVRIELPASWRVVDLATSPNACVRFDENAVYLGTPASTQKCPAEVAGRTEALVLTDDGTTLGFEKPTNLPAGTRPAEEALRSISGEASWRITSSSVTAYATIAAHPETIADILETARVIEPAQAPKVRGPALSATNTTLSGSFTRYFGRGFDTCAAPSISVMNAWAGNSPFGSIGIYIGGSARGCSQPNLTPSWLGSIAARGWRAQPIYVGPQAPCSAFASKIDPGSAAVQGQQAAQDASARARALGLGATSDIYYDMESYARGGTCTSAVQTFLSAWTKQLHAEGYLSGVYSSASTGIQDLISGLGQPGFAAPDKVWIARWNGQESVQDPAVTSSYWANYQRMHQYRGGQVEQYAGYSINIDRNWIETDSTRGRPIGRLDAAAGGYGSASIAGWAVAPGFLSSTVNVQMTVDGVVKATAPANLSRPDVAAAYPDYGSDRGFNMTVPAPTGTHSVCAYSIDPGSGTTEQLGCLFVNVESGTPFGYFDSAMAAGGSITVLGWALDPKTTGPANVHMYIDGVFSTGFQAAAARSDLAARYPGLGINHGFQVSVQASPGTHSVCLYPLDTQGGSPGSLGCRTVYVPDTRPIGRIDRIDTYNGLIALTGWSIDPKTSGPITVRMTLDSSASTTAVASLTRGDVGAAYPTAGPNHGFVIALPAAPGNHVACLYANDSSGGPASTVSCQTIYMPDRMPFGYLDLVMGGSSAITTAGWAIDPKTAGPITVQLYLDGKLNTSILANGGRPDVGAAYPWAGPNHGFRATLKTTAGAHTLCAYGINAGTGSNPVLGCRNVIVS